MRKLNLFLLFFVACSVILYPQTIKETNNRIVASLIISNFIDGQLPFDFLPEIQKVKAEKIKAVEKIRGNEYTVKPSKVPEKGISFIEKRYVAEFDNNGNISKFSSGEYRYGGLVFEFLFDYAKNGNISGAKLLVKDTLGNVNISTTYEFKFEGDLVKEAKKTENLIQVEHTSFKFKYRTNGSIESVYADSRTESLYDFDEQGRTLKYNAAIGKTYSYDKSGKLAKVAVNGEYGEKWESAYNYDKSGNLTSIKTTGDNPEEMKYTLGKNGLPLSASFMFDSQGELWGLNYEFKYKK